MAPAGACVLLTRRFFGPNHLASQLLGDSIQMHLHLPVMECIALGGYTQHAMIIIMDVARH
jgi:hypothetical protein